MLYYDILWFQNDLFLENVSKVVLSSIDLPDIVWFLVEKKSKLFWVVHHQSVTFILEITRYLWWTSERTAFNAFRYGVVAAKLNGFSWRVCFSTLLQFLGTKATSNPRSIFSPIMFSCSSCFIEQYSVMRYFVCLLLITPKLSSHFTFHFSLQEFKQHWFVTIAF